LSVLWPSRLSGPLDGAPLDGGAEALVIGLALPALLVIDHRVLRLTAVRALIATLVVWKVLLAVTVVPDGWCLRFTSPVPLFVGEERVPHAWDVRADWRNAPPRCSAIVTRPYFAADEFPVWFYNLPPATWLQPAEESERPPHVTIQIDMSGALDTPADGVFRVDTGADVDLAATIDGTSVTSAALASGVSLSAGPHDVALNGTMTGERWRLVPMWNDRDVWHGAIATMTPPRAVDRWLRPWAKWIDVLLIVSLASIALVRVVRRSGNPLALAAGLPQVAGALATTGRQLLMRATPLLLMVSAVVKLPRRLQNIYGAQLLIGLPFLALIAVRGFDQIGRTTWYTSGDDWWMFQRFAYRIYLQGYWLEGGEPVFWFQPLYRWIAGALHVVFGDSSVGELFWDGACAWAGALFAFHVTRVVGGFRWGVCAAVLTLALFTLGPGWYLFGRGLSEMTSAGLTYAAALLALRGRHSVRYVIAAGLCLALAFYTRLNNLPFIAAVAGFVLPLNAPAGEWWRWRTWWSRTPRLALAVLIAALVCAIMLFAVRTYYYTGSLNPLAGTQASARSVWQPTATGETPLQNILGSLAMVVTMSDPPGLEPRAIGLVAGIAVAIFALAGVRRFRQLPMSVAILCLSGLAGAFVARGSAYPGRFSIHLIPVTTALTVSAIALWSRKPRPAADRPPYVDRLLTRAHQA
jgi:hypothetical protein